MAVYTAIDDPEAYFQVKLYAGNSTARDITLDGDTDMQPDLVWIKERDDVINHYLTDSVRGAPKKLTSNTTAVENAGDSSWINALNSDGFSVGNEDNINDTGDNYVAWCWKESATSGFDIVAYTGNETARTIAHSLSAVPKMIIAKDREDGDLSWFVGHASEGWTKRLKLDGTNTSASNTVWNDTDPTSSVFSVGSSPNANTDGNGIIAYLFADVQGFSKLGSYTGNGNADGTFIYTGFRPAFFLVKNTNGSDNWNIYDNKRLGFNVNYSFLIANEPNAENTGSTTAPLDILSNGIKIRASTGHLNTSGDVYIYAAFAEAPFVNSNGVPCNAG